MEVVWTRAALRHLEEIQDYIAQQSPTAAHRLALDLTERTIASLTAHPMMGRRGRAKGTRELVLADTPFIIVYLALKRRVKILAIVHAARDWPESFD